MVSGNKIMKNNMKTFIPFLKYLFLFVSIFFVLYYATYYISYYSINDPFDRPIGSRMILGYFVVIYFVLILPFLGVKIFKSKDIIKKRIWFFLLIVHSLAFLYFIWVYFG